MKSFTHHENPLVEYRPDPPEPEKVESWEDLPAFRKMANSKTRNDVYFILTVLLDYYNRAKMLRADLIGLVQEFSFAYFGGEENRLSVALAELESFRQERGI